MLIQLWCEVAANAIPLVRGWGRVAAARRRSALPAVCCGLGNRLSQYSQTTYAIVAATPAHSSDVSGSRRELLPMAVLPADHAK